MGNLQPGIITRLQVERESDYGYFLTNNSESILLHSNEVDGNLSVGDEVEVFLYIDKQNRLAATMTIPEVTLDRYGWASVVEVKESLGVFVNIGIQKDILVSEDDLPLFRSVWPDVLDKLYVNLSTDKKGRLLAVPASENAILDLVEDAPKTLQNKDISGIVYRIAKVGASIITPEGYRGFIHESEMKEEPRLGQNIQARVINVKEDGTINLSLLPRKQEGIKDDSEELLVFMRKRGGGMPYSDKSQPEDIKLQFGISKAAFKRALGSLIKEEKVYQENGWTYLKE